MVANVGCQKIRIDEATLQALGKGHGDVSTWIKYKGLLSKAGRARICQSVRSGDRFTNRILDGVCIVYTYQMYMTFRMIIQMPMAKHLLFSLSQNTYVTEDLYRLFLLSWPTVT